MPTIAGRTRPIETFARATAKCGVEATAYGKCILQDYQSVHQDMCAREFMRLKDCYLVRFPPDPFVLSFRCCEIDGCRIYLSLSGLPQGMVMERRDVTSFDDPNTGILTS